MSTIAAASDDARRRAYSVPLEQVDPSDPALFENGSIGHHLERLRNEDPVHRTHSPVFGDFWSVTRYRDIMAVDTNHAVYSSDWRHGGIFVIDRPADQRLQTFITMDPPQHDEHRKAVSPIVAPANLASMESLIRERTCKVLDSLPRNQTFDWVSQVSIELTTLMLATLFDFPLEDRHLLTRWSGVITSAPELVADEAAREGVAELRMSELTKMAQYMTRLWNERVNAPPRADLISMLAHNPATRHMTPLEFMGNCALLIVGGNDTTRNSMSGGLLAMHDNPGEWAKLRANPALVDSLVPEIIRWQTPLPHMRRTAVADTELAGKHIRKGDKVVMWYLSGNRDAAAIDDPQRFIIDRASPRQHLSFGFGIHRCVGNRLAELQLKILWQEILARFPVIEVVGPPVRLRSNLVNGITELPVRVPAN